MRALPTSAKSRAGRAAALLAAALGPVGAGGSFAGGGGSRLGACSVVAGAGAGSAVAGLDDWATPGAGESAGGGLPPHASTNTATIQRAGAGIPAATIAVPGRYAHTPAMMINLEDYANVVKLAEAALRSLTPEIVKQNL